MLLRYGSLALLAALAASGLLADPLREAQVGAYARLARASGDAALVRAHALLAARAPGLLWDADLQSDYWRATRPAAPRSPVAAAVAEARAHLAAREDAPALEDPGLRAAFERFFVEGRMRERLAPHLESARSALGTLRAWWRARRCEDQARLARTGAWVEALEGTSPPEDTAAALLTRLRARGWLPPSDPRCPLLVDTCALDPEDGLRCEAAEDTPPLDRSALARRAESNPYLAALLERPELRPREGGGFDTPLQEGILALSRGAWASATRSLSRGLEALRSVDGAAGLDVVLSLHLSRAAAMTGDTAAALRSLTHARRVSGTLRPRRPQVDLRIELLGARLRRARGDWAKAARILDRWDPGSAGLPPDALADLHLERAFLAKLRGDLARDAEELSRALSLLEEVDAAPGVADLRLRLARNALARGEPEVAARELDAALPVFSGRTDPISRAREAGARQLRSVSAGLLGDRPRRDAERARAARLLDGLPPSPGLYRSLEPELLSGFARLDIAQLELERAAGWLVLARELALAEGGAAHPLLADLERDAALLERAFAEAPAHEERRVGRIERLLTSGRPRAAAAEARVLREELRDQPDIPPSLLAWLHFYELQGLYLAGDWARAHRALGDREDLPEDLPDSNLGWMASVGIELATRNGRPATEVLAWSRTCRSVGRRVGNASTEARCARLACELLADRGEEPAARPAAEALLRLGVERRDADWILEALELLTAAALREGTPREPLRRRAADSLRGVPLTDAQREQERRLQDALADASGP